MIASRQQQEAPPQDGPSSRPRPPRKASSGDWMHALATELFPICRSITGDGLRATLRRIQQEIPITIHEVPSGTPVLDWVIPDEWNIRDAWIANARGERVIDFRRNNLHVVNYSVPVRARMQLAELRPHLHTLPDRPEWIPYRTTYYKRDWGFCLSHRQLQELEDGEYDVCIDATLVPGALSYGELLIPGRREEEFLISVHCCHPSLANDNLSGVAVAVALAQTMLQERAGPVSRSQLHCLQHSYRFLFIPGTIGAITWLARHEAEAHKVKHGLVLTCLGDAGPFTYKRSRRGDTQIDQVVEHVLHRSRAPHRIIDFFPYGYDERQYGSPGFDLPVGCLMRSQHGTFPQYHTSADNLEFINAPALEEALHVLMQIIEAAEHADSESTVLARKETTPRSRISRSTMDVSAPAQRRFLNLKPKGEPQLGKYGIYEALGGDVMPALWLLSFSDGRHRLAEIAGKSGLPFDKLLRAADILLSRGLLKEVEP